MGKTDEYQYDYLDDNDRFADQINGALFQGKQLVKPEDLEPADAQAVYLGKEAGLRKNVHTIMDKARMWKGRLLHIVAVENQTYVDYHMVLRNMLSESLSYHKQWKQKKNAHDRRKDLPAGTDEFLSGLSKGEKFIPVITLVVYCGTEHPWDGARCLHDLLEIDEEMKAYVTNYQLNLYDCHEHDTFEEYHTGLRQIFEMVRYGKDKEQVKRIWEENPEAYDNIDDDTRELLEVITKIKIPPKGKAVGKKEGGFSMLQGFEDLKMEYKMEGLQEGRKEGRQEGLQEGRQEGIREGRKEGRQEGKREYFIQLVCKKLQKNKPASVIAEELEEELPEIERILAAQKKVQSYDVERICAELF